ncbi:transcriptional regulator [Dactylosporangium sp. CS-047395]|uniref:transcriptional regulator n=1 Tax=Dactylosporangium sp. CS-047395 TaxID=3239936 RepID=UPI003D8A211C
MMLVLHAVRLKGFADTPVIAARFGLDPEQTAEDLLDAEAFGWVARSEFAGLGGWSLTDRGRRHNEEQLRADLGGDRAAISAVHDRFVPLNAEANAAFTAWQLGDTTDRRPFERLAAELHTTEMDLTRQRERFAGYHSRFTQALAKGGAWITGVEVDSCHRVWFELHEDLIATLGIARQ